jgi:hypothetical protein
MPRKSTNKKPSLYQQVSKRFTAINKGLPEEKKLSIQRRRQIIKQQILPALSTTPKNKIRVKQINGLIQGQISQIPPRDPNLCNINFISGSQYTDVNWFEIDEFLQRRMPDCIYVKVSAGAYGQTKIFNTRNYNYYNNGVQEITERLRKDIDNKSGAAWYSGYQKLRPNMRNDGKPESYYLDMVLFIAPRGGEGVPQSSTSGETRFVPTDPVKKKLYKKEASKVNNKLDKLFGKLQKEKDAKKRAYRQIRKDDTKLKKIVNKPQAKQNTLKVIESFATTYQRAVMKINRYYEKGLINKAKYDKAIQELNENYNKFNQ